MVKLTSLQKINRDKCIAFANDFVNPNVKIRDKNSEFDKALWQKCIDLNIHGIFISKKYGGLEYSLQDGFSLYESIGFAFKDNGLSFGLAAQQLSCTMSIDKFASNDAQREILNSVVTGQSIVAHAITEKLSGSNVFDMKTYYTLQSESDLIHLKGEKIYSSNLPVSDYVLCYANNFSDALDKKKCSAFLIPTQKLQFVTSIEKMGLNTCIMGETIFDLQVSDEFMLNKEGQGRAMFQEAITYERIGMAALHLGTIERLLEEAISWIKYRKSGDSNLSQYQSLTHPIVNIYNDWILLRSYLYNISGRNLKFSKLYLQASILKDKVSELYVRACEKILQIYGGLGYTKQLDIERMTRDAMASKIYSGTSEIQKEIVWKFIS